MTTDPKTWKSHQDQLDILKARGMAVPDEARALDFLKRVGYYRLSGYFFPFRQGAEDDEGNFFRKDVFVEGSSFDKVIDLYLFDELFAKLTPKIHPHKNLSKGTPAFKYYQTIQPDGWDFKL